MKLASGQASFLGRDPIEESGGLNLYGFCGNNAINTWDYLGMIPPLVSNLVGAGAGLLQVGAGAFVGITAGWTGVGAVGGGLLVVNGGSQFVGSMGNLGSMAFGETPVLNASGVTGLASSSIAFAADGILDPRTATYFDIGLGTVASGLSIAPNLPNLVSVGFGTKATEILTSGSRAGGLLSQTGTTTAELSSFLQAGAPAISLGSATITLPLAAGLAGDASNVLSLIDIATAGSALTTTGSSQIAPTNTSLLASTRANLPTTGPIIILDPVEVKGSKDSNTSEPRVVVNIVVPRASGPYVSARDRYDNFAMGNATNRKMAEVLDPIGKMYAAMVANGSMTKREADARLQAMRLKQQVIDEGAH